MDVIREKKRRLEELLRGLGSVAVAFSAGVDSTFLLKTAHDVLGERAFAVTARSRLFPAREAEEAARFCAAEGIEQLAVEHPETEIEGFADNPPDRCYRCKTALFSRIRALAAERGACVVEGSNRDDEGDYRPGMRAVAELGVRSPLREAGLHKAEIRALSRELGLATWDKPSRACLASRLAYGERISAERLAMVEAAEQRLLELGFDQMRVRVHGRLARLEVPQAELPRLLEHAAELDAGLRALGFLYVTMDLGGYSTGSMNRALELPAQN